MNGSTYGSGNTYQSIPSQECTVASRERDVPNRLGQLQNWAGELTGLASELLKRIDPILSNHPRPADQGPSEKCPSVPCGLATSLDSSISQIRSVCGELKDAIDRCEL
jgi:hypothetical protein